MDGLLNDNVPVGTLHNPEAPWNRTCNPEREIEVTVSITLSKTMEIKVSDYAVIASGKDEDGSFFEDIDYSDCDLRGAVERQVILPDEAYKYIKDERLSALLKGWDVDDFEVIKE